MPILINADLGQSIRCRALISLQIRIARIWNKLSSSTCSISKTSRQVKASDAERLLVCLAIFDIGNSHPVRWQNPQTIPITILVIGQCRTRRIRPLGKRLIRPRGFRAATIWEHLVIVRAAHQNLAVVLDVRVVVDLVDHRVHFLLDRRAVVIGVRVVRRVDALLLERAQDLDGRGDSALGDLHHAVAVLRVLVVLIKRTDLHAHALGNRHARRIVACARDLHARGNLCKALRTVFLVLVQRVQRIRCLHIVLYY